MNKILKMISVCAIGLSSLYSATGNNSPADNYTDRIINYKHSAERRVIDNHRSAHEDNADTDENTNGLQHGGEVILRLGSCPEIHQYGGQQNDADNSYFEWAKGLYGKTLRYLGIPMNNVVHCYALENLSDDEQYRRMLNRKTGAILGKDGRVTKLVADFNSQRFVELAQDIVEKLKTAKPDNFAEVNNNSKGLFDYIITDNKVTKFIRDASGLYNILSTLKVGGKAIFTDLNEAVTYQEEINKADSDLIFSQRKGLNSKFRPTIR